MTVYVRSDESLESAVERFRGKVDKACILSEYKDKLTFKTKREKERAAIRNRSKKKSGRH